MSCDVGCSSFPFCLVYLDCFRSAGVHGHSHPEALEDEPVCRHEGRGELLLGVELG